MKTRRARLSFVALVVAAMATGVAVVTVGCAPRSERVLPLALSGQLRQWVISPARVETGSVAKPRSLEVTATPADAVAVRTTLAKLKLGLVNSPSVATETSVAAFRVHRGYSVPGHEDVRRIQLRYHHGLTRPELTVGSVYVFRFTQQGEFFDIDGIVPGY